MRHRADAGVGHVQLAFVRLGVGGELPQRGRRQVVPHRQKLRLLGNKANRLEIHVRLVGEVGIKRDRGCVRAHVAEGQRIAVGIGACDSRCACGAAGASDIFNDKLLSERAGELVRDDATSDVGRSAGGKRHDYCGRTNGIALRLRVGNAGQHTRAIRARSLFIDVSLAASPSSVMKSRRFTA